MLIQFQKVQGGFVAINPKYVMLVEEAPVGVNIIVSDGGTTRVEGDYLSVVGIINGALVR